MSHLTRKALQKVFTNGQKQGYQYIGVLIEMPGFDEEEFIINPKENFEKKLKYYESTYNEDLEHNHVPDLRIKDIIAFNDYKDAGMYLTKDKR